MLPALGGMFSGGGGLGGLIGGAADAPISQTSSTGDKNITFSIGNPNADFLDSRSSEGFLTTVAQQPGGVPLVMAGVVAVVLFVALAMRGK